ncbi:PREDICTED: dual specificity protein phosphatase 22 [Condylura cristata]|uniref:dual specificity protein phosphatase 22 n=1 Tax=Condylura cristata TaxID=143302 RepID=UPI0003344B5E|nr:PREDICTED: dual specificity protein phosphatase 22 [Condylura cristata]
MSAAAREAAAARGAYLHPRPAALDGIQDRVRWLLTGAAVETCEPQVTRLRYSGRHKAASGELGRVSHRDPRILPGLYIGNFKDARDAEQLSKNKVTHILSIHDSARPLLEGVKYLCIPAADSPSQNLTRHFKESIKFIHECRLRGEGCLVHCLAGVSRSVTLVIAYIMTVTDFGWEDALHTVRAGRSCANPNLGFQRQLQEFEKHEVHQYRQWLKEEYGESPLQDAEEARNILANPGILKYWAFLRRL